MLIAAALAQSTAPADSDDGFFNHLMKYNLVYLTEAEYELRQAIYNEKTAIIEEFNNDPESLSKHAHNQFSTWTQEEMEAYNTFRLEEAPSDASFH